MHPVGTKVVTLLGEFDDNEEGAPRVTAACAEGAITAIFEEQQDCYQVSYPVTGASVFLSQEEIDDPSRYRVLPMYS